MSENKSNNVRIWTCRLNRHVSRRCLKTSSDVNTCVIHTARLKTKVTSRPTQLNKCVFSALRNCPMERLMWQSPTGRLFHRRGPATAKERSPSRVRMRWMTHVVWRSKLSSVSVYNLVNGKRKKCKCWQKNVKKHSMFYINKKSQQRYRTYHW